MSTAILIEETVACSRCNVSEHVDVAVDGDWVPYYYDEAAEQEFGPTCPTCVEALGVVFDSLIGEWSRPGGGA